MERDTRYSDKMQPLEDIRFKSDPSYAISRLESEMLQIFHSAKSEVMKKVENIFEDAKTKAVTRIRRVKCGQVGQPSISFEDNNITENEQPDIIEDSQEAVIRDNLDRYELYISDCVKTTDLIAFFGPLSSAQTRKLRSIYKRSPFEATKTALQMIQIMEKQPKKYTLLLEALKDAGYPKVVQILNGTLIPVGSCHRNIIRQCAKHMFNQLHTSEILPYLDLKGVINNHDKQEILQTERTESTSIAALELLDMLPNRHKKWFKYFV